MKVFPFLFSRVNTAVVLLDENPQEALATLERVLEDSGSDRNEFDPLKIDIEIRIANSNVTRKDMSQDDVKKAIDHWSKAYALARLTDNGPKTRVQIGNYVKGRADYLFNHALLCSREKQHKKAIVLDRLAIYLIETVEQRLFHAPEDRFKFRDMSFGLLAEIYAAVGMELCNYFRDYVRGTKNLRKAVQINPHSTKFRNLFLGAMCSAADELLIKKRRTEASVFYTETIDVAQEGLRQQPNNRNFERHVERGQSGLEGEIDLFDRISNDE